MIQNNKQIVLKFFFISLAVFVVIGLANKILGDNFTGLFAVLLSFVFIKLYAPYNIKGKSFFPIIGAFLGLFTFGIILLFFGSLIW